MNNVNCVTDSRHNVGELNTGYSVTTSKEINENCTNVNVGNLYTVVRPRHNFCSYHIIAKNQT